MIQENLQRAFKRWGIIALILYILSGGIDFFGKTYYNYGPEVTQQIQQGTKNPQKSVEEGVSYVLVTYVGGVLRVAYNILRAISAHVAKDYVDKIVEVNAEAQNNPTWGDKIRNTKSGGYRWYNIWADRGRDILADVADEASGSNTVKQAAKIQTDIARQYGEVIAMAFVTGALYKFWSFFIWLYSATIFLFMKLFTFFFGSSSMIGKAFIGKGTGIIGMVTKGFLILIGLYKEEDISRGSARFSDRSWEKTQIHKKNKGLLVDGQRSLTERMSDRHVCVIAPSGQGKTSNYVIPNLLKTSGSSVVDQPSYIVTDPKGEIWRYTSGYLSSLGYDVQVINLMDVRSSHTFNPLLRANSDTEIGKAAEMIIDARFQGGGKQNTFFMNTAKMVLTLLIKIIKCHPDPKCHTLYNLFQMVGVMGRAGEGLLPFVTKFAKDKPNVVREFKSYLTKDPETISNVILTVQTALKDLAVKEIEVLTSGNSLSINTIREKPTIIYIITPPSDMEFFKFFLTMFYQQIFTFCEKSVEGYSKKQLKETRRISFLMDEFGNLGRIPSFDTVITTLRGSKCSVSIILQDIEQVRSIYGKSGSSAILNGGCSTKLIYGGIQNMETLTDVSKLLGNKTIEQTDDKGRKIAPVGRPLMMPDELSRMQIGEAIMISAGNPPVQLTLKEWESSNTFYHRGHNYPPFKQGKKLDKRYILQFNSEVATTPEEQEDRLQALDKEVDDFLKDQNK